MAAITTTYKENLSLGNRDAVIAKTAAVADTNTWVTGLSSIEHVSMSNGVSGMTFGYTVSGGTVTFAVASGPMTTVSLLAIGFK